MGSKYSEELANLIQDKMHKSKDYFDKHLLEFKTDGITYSVELIDAYKGDVLRVTMFFGGNTQSGEIYVDRNGKRVSAADLRDDILSFLWSRSDEATRTV